MRGPMVQVMRASLAAMALAAVLASAGCSGSSGPATDGPLRGGPFGAPSPGGSKPLPGPVSASPKTFGDERFTNHGHATVVLDRVGLRHPHNMRLIGSYAVPGAGQLVGVAHGFPPRYSGIPPAWKHRQQVHGFGLAPGKSFNMVLGVEATGAPRVRSPGMVIYYHDPAGSYVIDDRFAMIIAVDGAPVLNRQRASETAGWLSPPACVRALVLSCWCRTGTPSGGTCST